MSKEVGRNDPCPCGSGKKYKKCCGSGAPKKRQINVVTNPAAKAKGLFGEKISPKQEKD